MITCPKCGTQLEDGTTFCTNCGASLAAPDPAPAPTPVPAPAPAPQYQQAPYGQTRAQYQQPYGQPAYAYDPADHTAEFDSSEVADNKILAVSCYLFGFIGIIVAALFAKDSKYMKFHVKQALRLSIAEVLAFIPCIIPILGWIVTGVLCVILFVVEIIAIVWAFQGKSKDLPMIKGIKFLQ